MDRITKPLRKSIRKRTIKDQQIKSRKQLKRKYRRTNQMKNISKTRETISTIIRSRVKNIIIKKRADQKKHMAFYKKIKPT
jgi:hypothetical protein